MTFGAHEAANITVLTTPKFIGKRFDLHKGKIRKTSKPTFVDGHANARSVRTAAALRALIEELREGENLCLGVDRKGRKSVRVLTREQFDKLPDEKKMSCISRSQEYLTHPSGSGWLLIDFDDDGITKAVQQRIEDCGGVVDALKSIWPELRGAEMLVRPSSSSGVYAEDIPPTKSAGLHIYVLIRDPENSSQALRALHDRAIAAGFGWIKPSKSGQPLVRSIIDTAVGAPERMVFEAPPRLGKGLKRVPPKITTQSGSAISAPLEAPDVSERVAEAILAAHAKLEKRQANWRARKAAEIADKQGVSRQEAEKIVSEIQGKKSFTAEALLWDQNGRRVSAADLVRSVSPGCKISLPDPIEGPEYGATTATLFWGKGHAAPIIVSHAHGTMTIYKLPAPASKAVWSIIPAKLSSKRRADLKKTLSEVRGDEDLGVVLAVVSILSAQAPAKRSLDDVRTFLAQHLPPNAISASWIDAMIGRAQVSHTYRKADALTPVQLSNKIRSADYVTHCLVDKLNPVEDIRGVHVVRAPMGTGKTQLVGAPFINQAKRRTTFGDVWAITHRRTLVAELSQRLGLAHYENANLNQEILSKGGLAVCLPSILKNDLMFEEPKFIFIDEIGQVLRFFTAQHHCRTANATAADVFNELRRIVSEAEGVLVADAQIDDVVIRFLRLCRPQDTINITEMRAPEDAGITATVFAGGSDVRAKAVDDIATELMIGGAVWVACEGAGPAEDIGVYLRYIVGPQNVLVLTADTKLSPQQAAFFKNPEAESRKYRAVIASPVVSSGISVEHSDDPHFTLGAFIGSGLKIEPSDAVQMVGRVRYLDRFVLGLSMNNRAGKITSKSIIEGRMKATEDEEHVVDTSSFDRLVAGFQARSENLRADFAGGLWWQLEKAGWTLTRSQEESDDFAVERPKIANERMEERKAMLMQLCALLPATSQDEIRKLRRTAQTLEQRCLLEAWDMTRALGVATLTEEDIDFYDSGGIGKIDLFEDLTHRDEPVPLSLTDRRSVLVHRRLRRARRQHLKEIFEGFDLFADGFYLTPSDATVILDRIVDNGDAYAASGAVPEKYRRRFRGDKPKRPQNAVSAVKTVLKRAGVKTEAKQIRCHATPLTRRDESAPSRDNRIRVQLMKQKTVEEMRKRAQQRQATRDALLEIDVADHVAHIERAKVLVNATEKMPLWAWPDRLLAKDIIRLDVVPLLETAASLRDTAAPP